MASSILCIPVFSHARAFYSSARVPHLRCNCHHGSYKNEDGDESEYEHSKGSQEEIFLEDEVDIHETLEDKYGIQEMVKDEYHE